MARVSISVNNHTYEVACADGEEKHINALAAVLDAKVSELVGAIGQAGEARLLAMAGLLMADEIQDAKIENVQLKQLAQVQPDIGPVASGLDEDRLIERLETLASHIESIAERVEAS
ncbi:MAG: cell division protein ZapA [Magnetovibrio sp.]|nr:cell division protein ZapA [Magnetovibrio sp.]